MKLGFNRYTDAWALLGPGLLWAIMSFLTVPLTEKCMANKRGEKVMAEYIKSTNKYWPF